MLPDLDSLFPLNPQGEFEKFLLTRLEDDPEYIDKFAYVFAQIHTQCCELEARREKVRTYRLKEFADRQADLIQQDNPATVTVDKHTNKKVYKRYSLEAAEREIERLPSQRKYASAEIELRRRINILKGYMRAMELKSKTMPGEQGRLNLFTKMEGRTQ